MFVRRVIGSLRQKREENFRKHVSTDSPRQRGTTKNYFEQHQRFCKLGEKLLPFEEKITYWTLHAPVYSCISNIYACIS